MSFLFWRTARALGTRERADNEAHDRPPGRTTCEGESGRRSAAPQPQLAAASCALVGRVRRRRERDRLENARSNAAGVGSLAAKLLQTTVGRPPRDGRSKPWSRFWCVRHRERERESERECHDRLSQTAGALLLLESATNLRETAHSRSRQPLQGRRDGRSTGIHASLTARGAPSEIKDPYSVY